MTMNFSIHTFITQLSHDSFFIEEVQTVLRPNNSHPEQVLGDTGKEKLLRP